MLCVALVATLINPPIGTTIMGFAWRVARIKVKKTSHPARVTHDAGHLRMPGRQMTMTWASLLCPISCSRRRESTNIQTVWGREVARRTSSPNIFILVRAEIVPQHLYCAHWFFARTLAKTCLRNAAEFISTNPAIILFISLMRPINVIWG